MQTISKRIIASIIATGILFYSFVLSSGYGYNLLNVDWDFRTTGEFGDSFGPLNTLFASIAAIGALGAYFLQAKEVARGEHERSILQEQAAADRKSQERRDFESTFFTLLKLFRESVADICVTDEYGSEPVSGRDGIERIVEQRFVDMEFTDDREKAYRRIYFELQDDLGHYFRLFYHCLLLLDKSGVQDKFLYSRILRATLSKSEIMLIAANCMYGGGRVKLKALVERYSMLHNVSFEHYRKWRLNEFFIDEAFGNRRMEEGSELID